MDDTRVIERIESSTDRFDCFFCLPIVNGLPLCHPFVLNSFKEIRHTCETETTAKYTLYCCKTFDSSSSISSDFYDGNCILRAVKDSFFDKSISSSQRSLLVWRSDFFIWIWRKWLITNDDQLMDNFVTENV